MYDVFLVTHARVELAFPDRKAGFLTVRRMGYVDVMVVLAVLLSCFERGVLRICIAYRLLVFLLYGVVARARIELAFSVRETGFLADRRTRHRGRFYESYWCTVSGSNREHAD